MGNSANFKQYLIENLINLEDYKLHLAAFNGEEHPFDVYNRSSDEWKEWNEYRGAKDDFNRSKILCLIPDYHHPGIYIFVGVYKIIDRYDDWDKTGKGYRVKLSEEFSYHIGKLKIRFNRYQGLRGRSFRLEGLSKLMYIIE